MDQAYIFSRSRREKLAAKKAASGGLGTRLDGIPYSGIFSREKVFANRRYVRPNGNFGGKIFAVPLIQSHAYLTRATLSSSIVRVCFENKGVMSVSYTLEPMILSNLSLLFGSAVK